MDDGFAPIPGSALQPSLPRFHSLWLLVGFGPVGGTGGNTEDRRGEAKVRFLTSSYCSACLWRSLRLFCQTAAALRGALGGRRALRLRLELSSAWKVLNRTFFFFFF